MKRKSPKEEREIIVGQPNKVSTPQNTLLRRCARIDRGDLQGRQRIREQLELVTHGAPVVPVGDGFGGVGVNRVRIKLG